MATLPPVYNHDDQLRAILGLQVGQRVPSWYNTDLAIKALAEQLRGALMRIEELEARIDKDAE